MAKFKPYKIESSKLSTLPIVDGQLIVTTDTLDIYVDDKQQRVKLTPESAGGTTVVVSKTEPQDLPVGGLWFVEEDE